MCCKHKNFCCWKNAKKERERLAGGKKEKEKAEEVGMKPVAVSLTDSVACCSIHMEESLKNDDLIRQLCAQQDSTMDQPPSAGLPGSGRLLEVELGGGGGEVAVTL